VYLDPLDHLLAARGYPMVRYADDFVVLCQSAAEAAQALELIQSWVVEHGLMLHLTKTRVVNARTAGFDFLGDHFERDQY
jgi:RNA-directed DNA polymerase